MKEIDVDELKHIQLDMLKDVHAFCVNNNIKYSLAYGTLLGAVRHRGYIPWDDDIDIMMLREDYNRFVHSYGNDIYRIEDLSTDPDYELPYAKVEDVRTVMKEFVNGSSSSGVYIDIFPIDKIPDNLVCRRIFYWIKNILNVLFNIKTVKVTRRRSLMKNFVLLTGQSVLFFVSKRKIASLMSKIAKRYCCVRTLYVGIVAPADSRIGEAIPSSFFEDYFEIPFERLNVMSIRKYDKYLTATYGDYMQFPPVEERVSHHVYKAYWK